MKNRISNQKAYIAVSCLIVGTMILTFAMSTYSIFLKNYQVILSNKDAIKANYLAELAVDESIMMISQELDIIITQYLQDLKDYKINYLDNLIKKETSPSYYPPTLDNYLQIYFINRLSDFNQSVENPFLGYDHQHNYKTIFSYDKSQKRISIEGLGFYHNTRKRILVTMDMPKSISAGVDCFGLEKIQINPIKIVSYYQEIFK